MKKAGDFLSKFQKLAPPNDAIKRAIADAVHTVVGAPITKTHVQVHNGVAFIETSSIVKSKIRIERRAILELLFEKVPRAAESVRDIR